ncbi:hypothetical protein FJM67_14665 [Maribrevibacterium harenarium]|uniref:Secreted protein n=1 Tax=Maribrevibacterium harenarium TaxID=2589817 RepID=A0A501WBN7_9GAMM|nr:hypothetical protein [Maribrevibacterium harenarium]TPE47343.1 hypothetical protein FJM67_14665 [Maribrevibacterium harenarium]
MKSLTPVVLTLWVLGASAGVYAEEDRCTERLNKYVAMLERNAVDENVSVGQREASQNLLQKVARLKADKRNSDCAVFDKLLP